MKTRIVIFLFLLFHFTAPARSFVLKTDSVGDEKKWYHMISVGGGALIPFAPSGNFSISFPYSFTSDNSTSPVPEQFTSILADKEQKIIAVPFYAYVETGKISANAHFLSNYFFGIGYSAYKRNRGLEIRGGCNLPLLKTGLRIKSSIGVGFESMQRELGTIDNSQKNIDLLGVEASSSFTYGKDHSYVLYYDYAQTLNLIFHQQAFLFTPEIAVTTDPSMHKLNIGLHCSWRSPVTNVNSIELWQMGTNERNDLTSKGFVSIDRPEVITKLNDKEVSSAPYITSGVMIRLQLAYSF